MDLSFMIGMVAGAACLAVGFFWLGPCLERPPAPQPHISHEHLREDLREDLVDIVFQRRWDSGSEEHLPPEDEVWRSARAEVDSLMPTITAYIDRDRLASRCAHQPGCCTRCAGRGAAYDGPCTDCYGTGHPHP